MNSLYEMMIRRSRKAPTPSIPTDYVVYLPLVEDILDKSAYARTFTAVGGNPTFKTDDGIPCAEFVSKAYLKTTDMTGITTGGASGKTYSVWYRFKSLPPTGNYDWNVCGSIGHTGIQRQSMNWSAYKGYVSGGMWGGGYTSTTIKEVATDLDWHHIVLRYNDDGGDMRLQTWIDGEMTSYSDGDLKDWSSGGIALGTNSDANFQDGLNCPHNFAAFRVYDRAVTDEEIHSLYMEFDTHAQDSSSSDYSDSTSESSSVIPTDYVLYAPMDSYHATADTGQTLTYYNADSSNFTVIDGIPCFDCSTDTRRILTSNIDMSLNGTYTMSVWCRITSLTQFQRGMCFGNDESYKSLATPNMWMSTWEFCVGGFDVDTKTGTYGEANKWYHCVQTFDHGVCKLYLNGMLVYTSGTLNINVDNPIVSFGAATTYTNRNYLRGFVAAGRLYNRVLTSAEIGALAGEF